MIYIYLFIPFSIHLLLPSPTHFPTFALYYRTHSVISYHLSKPSHGLNNVDSPCNRLATTKIVLSEVEGGRGEPLRDADAMTVITLTTKYTATAADKLQRRDSVKFGVVNRNLHIERIQRRKTLTA
jgi:hypothetical protein